MISTTIQQATAAYFGITVNDLVQCGRRPVEIIGRHISRYLERQRGFSYEKVGELYGCNHATVMLSTKIVTERLAANDAAYADPVSAIASVVKSQLDAKKKSEAELAAAAAMVNSMACPTCGAPVIRELQRQIAMLNLRVSELGV